jgi:hypothetical protein
MEEILYFRSLSEILNLWNKVSFWIVLCVKDRIMSKEELWQKQRVG